MKIISKFHDYYDITISEGFDSSIIYKRETIQNFITEKETINYFPDLIDPLSRYQQLIYLFSYHQRTGLYKKDLFDVNIFKIGFCGNWYNVLRMKGRQSEYYIHQNDKEFDVVISLIKKEQPWTRFNITQQKSDELFLKYKSPVLLLRMERNYDIGKEQCCITSNPILKDFTFFKVKEPYTAYQDIENYISNILLEQKEIYKLNDKERIIKAGFDLKHSFRHRT